MSHSYDRISVFGLLKADETLFDNFTLPTDLISSKNDIVNSILLECYELECLYPDPDIMKMNIGLWSRKMLPGWERMYRALTEEYNPLHNFDRHEVYTDAGSTSENRSRSNTDSSRTDNSKSSSMYGSDSSVSSGGSSAEGTEIHQVNGYNISDPMANQSKDISTNNGTSGTSTAGSSQSTAGEAGSSSTTNTGTGTESVSGAKSSAHEGHLFGNVGLTKSQEMLKDEINVRELNMIDIITRSFRDHFCVLVY